MRRWGEEAERRRSIYNIDINIGRERGRTFSRPSMTLETVTSLLRGAKSQDLLPLG